MTQASFYFNSTESPTQYNLAKHLRQHGLKPASTAKSTRFNDSNLQLHDTYTQQLEFKHLLADLLQSHTPPIQPPTYPINDTNYREVLRQLAQHNLTGWILKPALLNNAEGIKLFKTLDEVALHFQGNNRYSGEHVLQRYITHPHLLNNHKYTFRMFVIITNTGQSFLSPQGYFNICRAPYVENDLTAIDSHLTNEHLCLNDQPNNWQIPTAKCPNFELVFTKMQASVKRVIATLNTKFSTHLQTEKEINAFSFFGFDYILDENLNLWLLEVNHCPCFPKEESHPLQHHLYNDFWQAVVREVVFPIITQHSIKTLTPEYFISL